MAKPFFTMEEACQALGKSEEEVRAMVRSGALREFRDAGKIFFKAEDVEKVRRPVTGSPSDSGEITLESVENEPAVSSSSDDSFPSLVDTSGGTSILGLEPIDEESPSPKKDDTVITASGIGVFDDDELEIDADPMAKTQITTGAGAADDQVSLMEGTGSGSGLLDLTRESDDTSLGAELLDEIYPGEDEAPKKAPAAAPPPPKPAAKPASTAKRPEPEPEPVAESAGEAVYAAPVIVGDPSEGLFGSLLIVGMIPMALAGSVAAAAAQNFVPDYALWLVNNFLIFLGGLLGLLLVGLGIGWFVGRAMMPRRV